MEERTQVPSLEEMRQLSDAELLRFKTTLTYNASVIDTQIASNEEPDEEWLRRANVARIIYQRGLSSIKNILVERGAGFKEERTFPLSRWMRAQNDVVEAARVLMDDDSEVAWDNLEKSIGRIDQFMVSEDFLNEVMA